MEARALPREAAAGRPGLIAPRLLRAANDARLVALVRQGQAVAFEVVYDRYHRPILSFCRHMLGDPEEAADAVQHTFIAAYTAIKDSDKPLLLRPWLFTIARNRCYSVLRARREHPTAELDEPATEGLAAQVQRREELRQLLVDLHHLPDDQRAALVMSELGALNHAEIASSLGVPAAKVKALVFQARESLTATRAARDIDCNEIREQLSSARGAALRRAALRRHLRDCQGCREYRKSIQRQRRNLAAILPVAPAAGLKEAVLGATTGGTATGGGIAVGGGLLASSAFKGLLTKGLIAGCVALLGTAGTIGMIHLLQSSGPAGALADSGMPSAASANTPAGGLDVHRAPLSPSTARHHAVAAARRSELAHRGLPFTRVSSGAGALARVAHRHSRAASGGRPATRSVAAVSTRRAQHVRASSQSRPAPPAPPPVPSGDGETQQGGGHGRGNSPGWVPPGHRPGHDPGRHLGWGNGNGPDNGGGGDGQSQGDGHGG